MATYSLNLAMPFKSEYITNNTLILTTTQSRPSRIKQNRTIHSIVSAFIKVSASEKPGSYLPMFWSYEPHCYLGYFIKPTPFDRHDWPPCQERCSHRRRRSCQQGRAQQLRAAIRETFRGSQRLVEKGGWEGGRGEGGWGSGFLNTSLTIWMLPVSQLP